MLLRGNPLGGIAKKIWAQDQTRKLAQLSINSSHMAQWGAKIMPDNWVCS